MNPRSTFILALLLITASSSSSARPDSFGDYGDGSGDGSGDGAGDGAGDGSGDATGNDDGSGGLGDMLEDISKGAFVCREEGPCYMKKLTCPEECYQSVSKSGNGFESSAGGGGCSFDCKETCEASCNSS